LLAVNVLTVHMQCRDYECLHTSAPIDLTRYPPKMRTKALRFKLTLAPVWQLLDRAGAVLYRAVSCPAMNDSTVKQIAAVKVTASKGSHAWI
jgi:hypothetical protein